MSSQSKLEDQQHQQKHCKIIVEVQEAAFDAQELESCLAVGTHIGAVASFIGYVRDHGDRPDVIGLRLEHYAGMTEKILMQHCQYAAKRWSINSIVMIHRVGELGLSAPIVGVAVASAHRQDAFDTLQFLMDFLKHDAPFWKQELTQSGEAIWVEQKHSDQQAKKRW
jgi:molybdopterin synthase catalytic subunit